MSSRQQRSDGTNSSKIETARFGIEWLLPEADWCWQRVCAWYSELPQV